MTLDDPIRFKEQYDILLYGTCIQGRKPLSTATQKTR